VSSEYDEVDDAIIELYVAGRYGVALELADEALPRMPERSADLEYAAACLLAAAGRPAEALDRLVAAEARGDWWHRRLLAEDDDLAGLRSLDGFPGLLERSATKADAAQGEPGEVIVSAPDGDPRGVLFALHGAGQTAAAAAESWRGAVEAGVVLVAVDSTQRNTPAYRSWPDPVVGQRDVLRAYDELPASYRALPLVAGGFSAGGRQALHWALTGGPAGFVVVAPAAAPDVLPDPVARGLPGRVILGEQDDDVGEDALASYEWLRAAGLAVELDLVPGLGHGYPADFGDRLRAALEKMGIVQR
jgi:predicted esterase